MSPFALWHPTCIAAQGGFRCFADVTATEFQEIHEGTHALVVTFARALGMSGTVREWTVGRFPSPYYAYKLWPDQAPLT